MAVLVCRSGIGDGLAKHGVACNFRRYRRLPARERRAMGFTLQSILKRVPIVIAPIVGGALIASMGLVNGVHVGLLITLGLAA